MLHRETTSIIVFSFIIGLGFLSRFFLHRLNVTVLVDVQDDGGEKFIAERAYRDLRNLNDIGPKTVGSYANEVEAFNYILKTVNEIRDKSTTQNISVDHQIVSGVTFGYAMYRNIQNVIVRVQGKSDHAMMLNCHLDSVPGSPGASDDSVMCCVMLETLRVISQSDEENENSIVFLFNGSEECNLQATHGFMTQHRWARDINAHINLESTGSSGRELLFRSGPMHDWIIHMYRKSAPRPFAQSVAEELFATGAIPASTDFQIFRDDGGIPGVDFAYIAGGWRYHTKYDSMDYITRESVQYTGENIFALTKSMANSKEIADPPEGDSAVYFDYLGFFMMSYTRVFGIYMNVVISIISVVLPFVFQSKFQLGSNFRFIFSETLTSFATILISSALSAGICGLIAMIMNFADNTMTYYSATFLSTGIYSTAAVVVQILVYQIVQVIRECCKSKNSNEKHKEEFSELLTICVHFNGVNLFWALLTVTITIAGFRFGYITMIILTFSIISSLLTSLCFLLPRATLHCWVFLHIFSHSFGFLFTCYMMILLLEFGLPNTGKEFFENPDTLVALICAMGTVLCLSYFIPLTLLVKRRCSIYAILLAILMTSVIVSFTPIGFPYCNDKADPRIQRFQVIHTKRSSYFANGTQKYSDIGYMISEVDRNSARTVAKSFNSTRYQLEHWVESDRCDKEIFCGFAFPSYLGFSPERGKYIKSFVPPTINPTEFKIENRTWDSENGKLTIYFSVNFTSMTHIYLEVEKNFSLNSSSLTLKDTSYFGRLFKIAWVTVGKSIDQLAMEYFVFKRVDDGADNLTGGKVAALTLINITSNFEKTDEFREVMEQLPDYTFSYEYEADSSTYEFLF